MPVQPDSRNRFGLGYRMAFNVSAKFKGRGGFATSLPPGMPGGDMDRDYDDGYVRRDSTVGDGLTWNWGYISPSQISGDSLLLSRSAANGFADSKTCDGNPHHGFGLVYQRQLNLGRRETVMN